MRPYTILSTVHNKKVLLVRSKGIHWFAYPRHQQTNGNTHGNLHKIGDSLAYDHESPGEGLKNNVGLK
jgi:hypothetical protein